MMNNIHTIRIKNFKAFPLEQEFVLAGNHLLIYGENGSGKSSLYFALYTLLQCSDKNKDASKYFTRSNPENLLNIFTTDDEGWIDLSFQNEPDKFHRLSAEGLIPNGDSDIIIREANLASDFISHRLLSNFYNFRNSKEINLFSVFERDILPFATTDKGENILALFNEIRDNKPYVLREGGVIARSAQDSDEFIKYQERITYFNTELNKIIENINEKVTDFYVKYFSDNKAEFKIKLKLTQALTYDLIKEKRKIETTEHTFISTDFRFLNDPFIKLFIQHRIGEREEDINRPQSFLNEAKLTAIALSIRFAVLDDKVQTTETKLLALDDLLISLDMSHRDVVLELLFTKYAQRFQLLLFTHDRAFFNLARKRIKFRYNEEGWSFYDMYADETNEIRRPVVMESGNHVAQAIRHYKAKDFPASANYLRKEIELLLKNILPKRFQKNIEGKDEFLLGSLLPKAEEYFKERGFDLAILNEILIYKEILLNPLSHDNVESIIYRNELLNVFKIVERLKEIRNDVIVPVNANLYFTVTTDIGNQYRVTFQLHDDVRLTKIGSAPSFYCHTKGDIVGCRAIKNGVESNMPYNYKYPKKTELKELYAKAVKAVEYNTKEKAVVGMEMLDLFRNDDEITLKQLMKY